MSPPERRLAALGELYGPAIAADIAGRIDALLAANRPRHVDGLDQRAAWLIAYPDHICSPGAAPLAVLDRFVASRLAPGISGIHTLPLHPASGDGGFSVIDPFAVDPAFGTWADVTTLASHHAWMADAVVNHLSASSEWFRGFLAGDPARAGLFATISPGDDVSQVIRPRTSPLAHSFTRSDGMSVDVWTTFSADQVDLDYRNPATLLAMTEAILALVGHGAAALRLDAIAFAWKELGTTSMSLPQTHALVQFWRACLDEVCPGLLLITETNVAHPENVSYFGAGQPEAGAVYQFSLPPLVAHSLLTGDCTVLAAWAATQEPPPAGCTFANMLATHDGIGVRGAEGWLDDAQVNALATATEAAGGVVNRRSTPSGERPYELAVSWYALMTHGFTDDEALARHLAGYAIALALRGFPLLWFNALFAVGNDVETFTRTGHARDLNRARFQAQVLGALLDDPTSPAARCWSGFAEMLAARASSPAFAPEAAQTIHDAGPGVFVVERTADSGERAVVAVNVTGRDQHVALPTGPTIELAPWAHHWQMVH